MTDEQLTRWASQVWGISNWNEIQIGRLKQFAQLVATHKHDWVEMTKTAWQDGYDTAIREREQK